MKHTYIDLVIAKHSNGERRFLFRAPAWSNLKKAEDIICETEKGISGASVIASVTVNTESREYEFIKEICGAYEPLKRVLARVEYREFDYEEEEEDAVDSDQE